jgi:hypothetical protein
MSLTRTTAIRFIRLVGIILLVGFIVTYAVWRSINYVKGPSIKIYEPANGTGTSSPIITIRGQAERVKNLSMNGKAISVDELGNFSEVIIVLPGLNVLTFEADDQFGRSVSEELDLVGTL